MRFALDSWAVLRLLDGDEPAASRVEAVLDAGSPVMSWINLGEVLYITRRDVGAGVAEEVIRDLRPLLALDLPSEMRVLEAAEIKASHVLAYADAFAAATAIAHDAILLTGDPELLVPDTEWVWEDLRE